MFVPVCALLGAVCAAAPVAAESPPRYKLKPGQEMTYRLSKEFNYGKGDDAGCIGSRADWTVWVVRANPDGGWRLVLRRSLVRWRTDKEDPKKNETPAVETLAYCDFAPDGRILRNDSLGMLMDPSSIFPRLPDSADGMGWDDVNKEDGVIKRCTLAGEGVGEGDPRTFVFDQVTESPLDKIYLTSSKTRITFDRERGLVTKATEESTQGYGFVGKGTGTTELVGVKAGSPDFMRQLAAEVQTYCQAIKRYSDLNAEAGKNTEKAEELLASAAAALKAAKEKVKLEAVRRQIDSQLKRHAQYSKYAIEDARRRAKVVGKPAAAFKTTGLDGKEYSLDGLRGKVLVLDFWYRGCGWCIRAMPQVRELANDFKGQPVLVLGMNTDRDEKDARFTIDAMKLNYPTLKAEGLPEKLGVVGFPTLVIIDQSGTVRDLQVGYSPTLREEVGKIVRELLKK